jgi:hemerythrin-like domain-containing protein
MNSLASALEAEHHTIDAAIDEFAEGLEQGLNRDAVLKAAIESLRRHIFVEERFVFPRLRLKGAASTVMVMLREHGRIWRTLDALEDARANRLSDAAARKLCRELKVALLHHNPKEERAMYPLADDALSEEEVAGIGRFLHSGRLPGGWVCDGARSNPGRRAG